MGAVRADAYSGVTETTMFPDWPAVKVMEAGATVGTNEGVVEASAWTAAVREDELRCVPSPM